MMPKSSYLFFKVLYLGVVLSEIFISVNRVFRTKMENETQGINILSLRLWTVSDLAATAVNSPPASGNAHFIKTMNWFQMSRRWIDPINYTCIPSGRFARN